MAAPSSTSPQWDNRHRSFISPHQLQQIRQASPSNGRPVHEFPARMPISPQQHQYQEPEQTQFAAQNTQIAIAPPQPQPQPQPRPSNQSTQHTRTSSFFSFRTKPSNPDWQEQSQQQRQMEPRTQGRKLSKAIRDNSPSEFGAGGPQLSQSQSVGPAGVTGQEEQQQPVRRISMAAPPAAPPPLHPEIRSVVQLTLSQARKIYFAGPLVRRIERQPDGQRPAKDEGWKDIWAQLGGTTLSIWDMRAIEEANKQGKEVPPTYINMTDAFIAVLGSVTVPETQGQPARKYTNILTLNTAGSNLVLFSCPSSDALLSWLAALRLAAWEKSRLEEIYTGHLIRTTLPDVRSTLVNGRMQGWVKVRVSGQTDWKRMWLIISSGSHSALDLAANSSIDSARPTSPNAPRKKRMSDLFSRSHSPETLPLDPQLSFFSSPRPKDKKKTLLTLQNVSQAFAVYPERPELITRSTLMKVEGLLGDEETAGAMRNKEGWLLIMPELEGGNTQAVEMLKWLVALHDAFELYGRPRAYTWDPNHAISMLFSYPVGPGRDHLFLDREAGESVDPREDRTSAVRSRFRDILLDRARARINSAQPPMSSVAAPSLPPIGNQQPTEKAGVSNGQVIGNGDDQYKLPSIDFEKPGESVERVLTPIKEGTRETLVTDFGRASQPASKPTSDEQGLLKNPSLHATPSVIQQAPQESDAFGQPYISSPPPISPPSEYSQSHMGSRPDSKLSPRLETEKTTSMESTTASSMSMVDGGQPKSPPVPPKSPQPYLVPLPSTPAAKSSLSMASLRSGSPPFSVMTSPHSPSEAKNVLTLGSHPASSAISGAVPSPRLAPPQAPAPAPDQSVFTDAIFYMQQLDEKPKVNDTNGHRIPTTISEDDESTTSEFEMRPNQPEAELSTDYTSNRGPNAVRTAHMTSSRPPHRVTPNSPMAFIHENKVPNSLAESVVSGARPPLVVGRKPSGARGPHGSRTLHSDTSPISSPERLQKNDVDSMAEVDESAMHSLNSLIHEDTTADALAALSFLSDDTAPAPPPAHSLTPPPPQVTRPPAIEKTVNTDSRPGSSENGSHYRSSFAPSKQAAERKARAQAQQAAHHAAVHRPGRLNGKRTVSGGSAMGWNESSEEEEEEEEEEDDEDEDADSDDGPSTADSKHIAATSAPPLPADNTRPLRPHSRNQSELAADVNSQLRQPRNLPPVPRQQQQDDYFNGMPPPRRVVSEQHPHTQSQYNDSQMRPSQTQIGFDQHAAARQSIWTQVLEPGSRNHALPESSTNIRDTFIQMEAPSQSMTKAFTPHGLLSAGIQDKQDRSAKRQEILARETGASLINVPNKPPPPQTGLLGAITAHERERKREGGVGAALTEREREKRVAEERQRKLDDLQRQQLEMAQSGASMYSGQPFPGFNPMMGNPMMMGMNPMMSGYMGFPGMMPGYSNPQYMFAAQQAAQAAYQQAMMAFSAAGSHVGEGMHPSPPMNPMMTGAAMGGFDPRMSMMGMPIMGSPMPPMGMNMGMGGMGGMPMTGNNAYDPRFSSSGPINDDLRPPQALGGHSPGQGSSRNSSTGTGSPAGPRPVDAPEGLRSPAR